jgi:hypothetical protein
MTNLSSLAALTNEIRGIKPPVRIPGEWDWLWWLLAALVIIGGSIGFMAWRRRGKPVLLPPAVPPHVRARQRLAEALLLISDPDKFCTAVSHTLRLYLEERFQLHAPERTTEEFLVELHGSAALNPEQKKSLQHFLQSCDLVKFARLEPNETALRDLHDSALRLVDETQYDPIQIEKSGVSPAMPPPVSPAPAPPPPPPPPLNPASP